MNSNKYMSLKPAPLNPNFDKLAAIHRQHTMSLYVRKEEKTDFYNDFMTRPDHLCSKEQKKMKFFMAMGTGDYENIPKSSEKLWGKEFKDLKESEFVEFDRYAFDKVKP